jgi:Flp pilus assembly pilin Flp
MAPAEASKQDAVMPQILIRLSRSEGQTMAEYAGVLAMITLLIVTTIATLSGSIQSIYAAVAGVF